MPQDDRAFRPCLLRLHLEPKQIKDILTSKQNSFAFLGEQTSMQPLHNLDPAFYPDGADVEHGGSAVAWPAIWAGTVTIVSVSLVMVLLGSGFGLAEDSPWPGMGVKPMTFTVWAGIWLIVTQWVSAALGGYMAGRLRVRWHGLHTSEVLFRDTAHGLLSWAVATIVVVGTAVVLSALGSMNAPTDVDVTVTVTDAMRKAASAFAIYSAISMLVGAFIACVAAAIGGGLRDKHP